MAAAGPEAVHKVEIAGGHYAVWQGAPGEWSCMPDACPHRLAPLSEGRVDPDTKCVECPYHGWQFDAGGGCTRIPQAEAGFAIPGRASVDSLPTRVTGDIVWAFFGADRLGGDIGTTVDDLPDLLYPRLRDSKSVLMRDLPYSFDMLVENFMDPGHIPFAHHGKQGVRSDGAPIPMSVVADNDTHIELRFDDVVRGKPRDGIVSFAKPCHYHFRVRPGNPAAVVNRTESNGVSLSQLANSGSEAGEERQVGLYMLCVPVTHGKSRVMIVSFPPAAKTLPAKIFAGLPLPVIHALGNGFVDTDAWLHNAERVHGTGTQYVQLTESDNGVIAFRKWWRRNLAGRPVWGTDGELAAKGTPLKSASEQTDWYKDHVVHCSACQSFLERARKAELLSPLLALAPVSLGMPLALRLAGLLAFVLVRLGARKVVLAYGPRQ